MKEFTKRCLKVAAVLGIAGILGVGAGLMLGGRPVLPARVRVYEVEAEKELPKEKEHERGNHGKTESGRQTMQDSTEEHHL